MRPFAKLLWTLVLFKAIFRHLSTDIVEALRNVLVQLQIP